MRHRPPTVSLSGRARLFCLAAIIGLLALPVEYRGGAREPHAHAAYQIWYDAAHGSVAHHHTGGDDGAHRVDILLPRQDAAPVPTADAAADVPRLVSLTIGATKIPLLVIAVLITTLFSTPLRPAWPPPRFAAGRGPRPETPPPRPIPLPA